MRVFSFIVLVVTLAGCARDLQFGDDSRYIDATTEPDVYVPLDGDTDAAVPPPNGPHVKHTLDGEHVLTRVNAISATDWTYLDLDTGNEVTPESPENDAVWDLAFRRSNIATNGGVSGTGGVEVAAVRTELADVTTAPTSGFAIDAEDGADEDTIPDYAFRAWYLYDAETHILTPDAITYVVRTSEGAFVRLRIAGYYDGFGTSGNPSFRWSRLP